MRTTIIQKIILLLCLLAPATLFAQTHTNLLDFEIERRAINSSGMLVLGGWAAVNIISGSIGYFSTRKSTKYFHQFNAAWNTVNLGIAVLAYLQSTAPMPENLSNSEVLKEFQFMQNLFLLNAGLDIAYIVTGLYLNEKSKFSLNHKDRLKGYSTSLFIQGGFLLAFDIIKYFIHQSNANINLYPMFDPSTNSSVINLTLTL